MYIYLHIDAVYIIDISQLHSKYIYIYIYILIYIYIYKSDIFDLSGKNYRMDFF